MTVRRLLLGGALIVLPAVVLAQSQALFRSETNYVEVDAVVTDSAGRFVTGLSAAEFEVCETRQPQKVATFSYVDLPTTPGGTSTSALPVRFREDLPQADRLNADRIYLLYLNSRTLLVQKRAEEFVRDFMLPSDIAAVWNAELAAGVLMFTNNKRTLLEEIGPFPGAINEPAVTYQERNLVEGRRLRDAIDWLNGIQGRRKALILFTEGWATDGSNRGQREREVTDWLQGRRPGLAASGLMFNPTDITERSDVHVYAYDVRGLVSPLGPGAPGGPVTGGSATAQAADRFTATYRAESASNTVLRSIADQSGGLAFVESNDYQKGFARIVEDNSRYYVLGYYSTNKNRDGVFRPISVKVNRTGVKVRARDGYVAR